MCTIYISPWVFNIFCCSEQIHTNKQRDCWTVLYLWTKHQFKNNNQITNWASYFAIRRRHVITLGGAIRVSSLEQKRPPRTQMNFFGHFAHFPPLSRIIRTSSWPIYSGISVMQKSLVYSIPGPTSGQSKLWLQHTRLRLHIPGQSQGPQSIEPPQLSDWILHSDGVHVRHEQWLVIEQLFVVNGDPVTNLATPPITLVPEHLCWVALQSPLHVTDLVEPSKQ